MRITRRIATWSFVAVAAAFVTFLATILGSRRLGGAEGPEMWLMLAPVLALFAWAGIEILRRIVACFPGVFANKQRRRTAASRLAVAMSLAVFTFVVVQVLVLAPQERFFRRLRITRGVVAAQLVTKHNSVEIAYQVGGSRYSLIGGPRGDGANRAIGSVLPVYYDAENPANALLDPDRVRLETVCGAMAAIVLVPLVIVGSIAVREAAP